MGKINEQYSSINNQRCNCFWHNRRLRLCNYPVASQVEIGQTILDIGPKWHKSKQGTPNMGGLMFIIGIVISFALTVLIYHLSGGNLESEYSSIMNGRELVLCLPA